MVKRKSKSKNRSRNFSLYKVPVVRYPKWVSLNMDDEYSSAGSLILINEIAQGTNNGSRIGNRINMGKVQARLTFAPSATDGNDIIRLIIFEAYGSVLLTDMPDVFTVFNFNKGRVYKDLTVPLNIQGSNISVAKKYRTFTVTLNKLCQYQSGTQDDIGLGKIYLYIVSDSLADPHPTVSGSVTLFFRDIN